MSVQLAPGQVVRMRDRHNAGQVVDVTITEVRHDHWIRDVRVFGLVEGVERHHFHGADLELDQ